MSISKGCIKLENQLIAALPTSEYERLIPHLE
ncbi:MAG: Crp/Fnr family transcriptional regulator, partial [Tolypothrix sp. Co-bin9]|nr:Crp/Fnr family transcriptional regulator [Tolypothrix sp. Co-bin9]